jgi:DUF1680 family protein
MSITRRDFLAAAAAPLAAAPRYGMEFPSPKDTALGGLLGEAVECGRRGRLRTFITGDRSKPVALFSPEARAANLAGDWYGEHAGKWLYTAARAAASTGDPDLTAAVRRVAAYLAYVQEPDGYLGTYAPAGRMTSDAAYDRRTWDVWVHSYMMIGLLEVHRYWPDERWLGAARKIGELCIRLFGSGTKSVAYMGNHTGLSGTVLLEPMVDLYRATGGWRYLELARRIVRQMEERPGLELVSRILAGKDVEQVADGKIYQLCWNLVGLAKLYEATSERDWLKVCVNAWRNIREDHLTLDGGPWGGVGRFSEVFNPKGFFSPWGFVETCSTMSWLQLSRELLRLTGEAQYAEEIERTAYNALLGAQDPNGEDWCYFIYPNGKRHNTYYWACCKSSGALALEEIAPLVYGKTRDGAAVNLYTPSKATVAGMQIEQETEYPHAGRVTLRIGSHASLPLTLRIPQWAAGARVAVNREGPREGVAPGTYVKIAREWRAGDTVTLDLPMKPEVHRRSQVSKQEGAELMRRDYVAVTRGPLVYASGLIDGFKRAETVRFSGVAQERGGLFVKAAGRAPIPLRPYYEAGGRKDGAWRLTWLETAE